MPGSSLPHLIHDDDDSNESLLMHDIARLSKLLFDRRVRSLQLTRSQWLVIGTLRRHPGISQAQLAEKLDVEPITVTRTLDRLEKAGWIERHSSTEDRRVKQLFLTRRVQEVVTQMRALGIEVRQELLKGITSEEHKMLLDVLKKIRKNLCQKTKINPS